ncbi:hypothetical protein DH2020_038552 [Rehmannia glutinosa]|uniref:Uncharacterized protein n=1 Tax=Rehmannia glutinosa TaxID=99300 RepID=A0ABR0UYH5_REHGL
MGRVDTNANQYHQGLQFQEFHHHNQTPETIDDAPPHDDTQDLYDPPSDYQKPPQSDVLNNVKPRPQLVPNNEAQPFPPVETVQFPPIQTSNVNDHHHQYYFNQQQQQQQQQQTGMQQGFGQPVGGIPVGMSSPSPFIPQQVIPNQLPTQAWKTDLFDCMRDPQNAIITLFFPCVTFGQIAEILDTGNTSCGTSGMLYGLIACCIAMPCIMSCTYRSKMRSRFGLIESPAPDWLVHCFCEHCALCQEYRELQERGVDPAIGWLGNVAKQQQKQQFGMTPPMHQRMM